MKCGRGRSYQAIRKEKLVSNDYITSTIVGERFLLCNTFSNLQSCLFPPFPWQLRTQDKVKLMVKVCLIYLAKTSVNKNKTAFSGDRCYICPTGIGPYIMQIQVLILENIRCYIIALLASHSLSGTFDYPTHNSHPHNSYKRTLIISVQTDLH